MVFKVESSIHSKALAASFRPLRRSTFDNGMRVPLSKLVFDKVFAAVAILFFSPFILLLVVLILITEGRPVLFAHERIGHRGRRFNCLKFRTMCNHADARLAALLRDCPEARAEWEQNHKLADDPRVSRLGKFLRKTSFDELPQFWNVLKGDMSIVGPRPVVKDEARFYQEFFTDYKSVRPGLTGAWQISGRSDTTYDERVVLDVNYVHNRTFLGDVGIVLRTVHVVLKKEGAR